MKILLTFFLMGSILPMQATKLDHLVDKVIIFQNQAQVFRSAKVKLSAGSQEIVFSRLSSQVDRNAIQVSGTSDFVILESFYRSNHLTEAHKTDELVALEESLKKYHLKDNQLHNEIQSLKDEEGLLKANQVLGGKNDKLTVVELQQMAQFYRNRIQSINDKIYTLRVAQREVKNEIKLLKKQINELTVSVSRLTGEIVVKVQAENPASGEIMINYLVNGASWSPTYDARVRSKNQPFDLYYNAQISQQTGEDWKNVSMTLSTSAPSREGSLPTFYPWYLDFYRQQPHANFKAMQSGMAPEEALFETSADAVEEYVVIEEQLTAIDYKIEKPVTVISNNQPTTVSIRSEKINAEYMYMAYPKISNKVFLTATSSSLGALDLLPGPMQVFYQGALINQTFLNPRQQEESMTFSLGEDQSILVKREELRDFTKDRVIGNKRIKNFTYQFSVINNKRSEIKIKVIDQLPVSKNADIDVEVGELDGAQRNNATGKLSWIKSIPVGGQQTIKYDYTVKYPKDRNIGGL